MVIQVECVPSSGTWLNFSIFCFRSTVQKLYFKTCLSFFCYFSVSEQNLCLSYASLLLMPNSHCSVILQEFSKLLLTVVYFQVVPKAYAPFASKQPKLTECEVFFTDYMSRNFVPRDYVCSSWMKSQASLHILVLIRCLCLIAWNTLLDAFSNSET